MSNQIYEKINARTMIGFADPIIQKQLKETKRKMLYDYVVLRNIFIKNHRDANYGQILNAAVMRPTSMPLNFKSNSFANTRINAISGDQRCRDGHLDAQFKIAVNRQ